MKVFECICGGDKKLDNYLTVQEVADSLRIPANTVRYWLRRKELKGVRLGRHWRIKEVDLQAFIKQQEEETHDNR